LCIALGYENSLNRIKLIGILTVIAGVIGVLSPVSTGGSLSFSPQIIELFYVVVLIPIVGMILSALGIGFGIAMLLRRNWAWKANIVLQIILIPFLTLSIVSYLRLLGLGFNFLPINSIVVFGITIVVLLLLVRPKTRAEFTSRDST
jgi:hypothetical protein